MNCKQAYIWILTAEEPAAPPEEVREHLQSCRRCRRKQQRVLQLDRIVEGLPCPAEDPVGRLRFLHRLDQTPAHVAPRRFWRTAATIAAVLLLAVGLSWLMVAGNGIRPSEQTTKSEDAPVVVSVEDTLVPLVLKRDIHLAETFTPEEQVQELAGMAADLREETLRLVRRPASTEVPLLAALYDRVLREGVVGRARRLPPEQKQFVLKPLVDQLRASETETAQLSTNTSPDVTRSLNLISMAARDASHELENNNVKPLPTSQAPDRQTNLLLETLVIHGLRLAQEDDLLRRADYCTDVADVLAQNIARESEQGNKERAERLTSYLGEVRDQAETTRRKDKDRKERDKKERDKKGRSRDKDDDDDHDQGKPGKSGDKKPKQDDPERKKKKKDDDD